MGLVVPTDLAQFAELFESLEMRGQGRGDEV
jgi:hypothetical protein